MRLLGKLKLDMRVGKCIHFRKKFFFTRESFAVNVMHSGCMESPILHSNDNVPTASGIGHGHDSPDEFVAQAIPRRRSLVLDIQGLTLGCEQLFDVALLRDHEWSVLLGADTVYPPSAVARIA